MREKLHETSSLQQTQALAQQLAEQLEPGDAVFLSGDLGAGKTAFVRAACIQLGVEAQVTSPTFVIGQLYSGRFPIAHLDLYRLEALGAEDEALIDDHFGPQLVTFVEWPDVAINRLPKPRYEVTVAISGENSRKIRITSDASL